MKKLYKTVQKCKPGRDIPLRQKNIDKLTYGEGYIVIRSLMFSFAPCDADNAVILEAMTLNNGGKSEGELIFITVARIEHVYNRQVVQLSMAV